MFSLSELKVLSQKPKLFTPGTKQFWTDPYISKQVLPAHLDADLELASYKHEKIDEIVQFIAGHLNLKHGDTLLDAGCGPGLYCQRFAKRGLHVTGLDFSQNSVDYARNASLKQKLNIEYVVGDYLDMSYESRFNCVLNIYYDFCVLSYEGREKFLKNVYRALKKDGYFVLDVSTPFCQDWITDTSEWSCVESGFWSPKPYLVLENHYYYPEETAYLNQSIVIGDDFFEVYRIYQMHYTYEAILQLLSGNGFQVVDAFEDLTGKELQKDSRTIGIIARKV